MIGADNILIGCGLVIAIIGTISFVRILWRLTSDMVAPAANATDVQAIGFIDPQEGEEHGESY